MYCFWQAITSLHLDSYGGKGPSVHTEAAVTVSPFSRVCNNKRIGPTHPLTASRTFRQQIGKVPWQTKKQLPDTVGSSTYRTTGATATPAGAVFCPCCCCYRFRRQRPSPETTFCQISCIQVSFGGPITPVLLRKLSPLFQNIQCALPSAQLGGGPASSSGSILLALQGLIPQTRRRRLVGALPVS